MRLSNEMIRHLLANVGISTLPVKLHVRYDVFEIKLIFRCIFFVSLRQSDSFTFAALKAERRNTSFTSVTFY